MTAPAEGARASRLAGLLAGVAIGSTAWVSLGVIALVDVPRMTRVGALPPWSWLAGLQLAGVGLALAAAGRLALAPLVLLVLPWLPWLPFAVPGAFLLWDGPLEGAVWTAVLGGCSWPLIRGTRPHHAASATSQGWWQSPSHAPWFAGVLFSLLAVTSWWLVRPRLPAGDEPHYLVITQSLLRDGDLRIENNHRDEQYLEYYDAALKPDFMRRGTDRQIYSIHAPGVSALVLPAFAVGGYPAAVTAVVGIGALGMATLWRLAFLLSGVAGAAWIAVAAVATAAPVLLHAFTIYPDPVGGALTLSGVSALVALDTGARRVRGRAWLATGAALALLPWLHTRFALIAGVLGVALALRLWRQGAHRADLARLLTVPIASAVAWFAYFYAIYGTANPAAPYGARPEGGLAFIPSGLAGLLVDQQFGLFATAPVLVTACAGLVMLARERRRLTVELLAVVVPYTVVAASYPMWWGGYSAPARFVVALVPMAALPIGVLWARGGVATRAVIGVLLAISAALTATFVGVDRGAFVLSGRDGYAPLLDWLSRSVDLTLALPSVHRDGMTLALEDAAVWLMTTLVVAALAVLAARLAPRLRVAAAVASVPVVVMLACTIAWTGRGREVVTPTTSQMSWLTRWSPGAAPIVMQLVPTRRLSVEDAPRRLNIATSRRGRLGGPDEPLLSIPQLPAGDYDLFIDAHDALTGEVTVTLGRQEVPMERWRLDGRPHGFSGLVLHLPVDAHSVTVRGDGAAEASVQRTSLRPRVLATRGTVAFALRAARYGHVVVFALDDQAFMEPGALWVRGEQTAQFVARADDGHLAILRLTGGPIANDVRMTSGAWTRTMALAPNQTVDVVVPAEALSPSTLTVTSTTGFRPSEHGGSGDVRWLGVYLTWPDTATPATGAATP